MEIFKHFLTKTNDIDKSSYVWNMIGSMINAFQSVFFLMILTRVLGIEDAGIFTIAYANANLFLNIGKYGMRYFQVSDFKGQYTFEQYERSRYITTFLMCIVSILYILIVGRVNKYSFYKSAVILCMCLWKAADSIEDVYHADLQRSGRLDVAGKMMSIRTISMIVVWAAILVMTKNLLISLSGAMLFTFICLGTMLASVRELYSKSKNYKKENAENVIISIVSLLKTVFPLFASAFLAFYIGNAPKYAIDAQLTDELQACYGFIAMPVFVIGLLNGLIFNPVVAKMSIMWNQQDVRGFLKRSVQQVFVVIGITLCCVVGAYIIGIPVLSWLYHTDLSGYKTDLILMLIGGGFLGLSGLLNALIIIQRAQKYIIIGYLSVAAIAFVFSNMVVGMYSIRGAVYLYLGLMATLCFEFVVVFVLALHKKQSI